MGGGGGGCAEAEAEADADERMRYSALDGDECRGLPGSKGHTATTRGGGSCTNRICIVTRECMARHGTVMRHARMKLSICVIDTRNL